MRHCVLVKYSGAYEVVDEKRIKATPSGATERQKFKDELVTTVLSPKRLNIA